MVSLNAFFLWFYSRRLGALAFSYVGFVALSSVYLAWHYAIDGYVGIAVTGLIVLAVRRWLPDAPRWTGSPGRPVFARPALTAS
jgi:hypothetical protein